MQKQNSLDSILYIDAANLIMSAKDIDLEYDIFHLVKYLKDRYRLSHCIYFTANIKSLEQDYELMSKAGIEIIYKKIYYENNKTKANCDVEIANRITEDVLLNKVDKVYLLSGDGDFISLYDFILKNNKKSSCIAITKNKTSKLIKSRRDLNVTFIDELNIEKRKSPIGHVASTGVLFNNYSITDTQNLSNEFIVVYVTHENKTQAEKITHILFDENIIACVNYFPIESCYFWKGEVANTQEIVTLFKTKKENWSILKKVVLENHVYDIPCIIKFDAEGNDAYVNWVKDEVNKNKT